MKLEKKHVAFWSGTVIAIAVYLICLFLVNTNYTTTFWVSFGFIMAAIVLNIVAKIVVSSPNKKSVVSGLPLNVLSWMYLVVEFILGTIFMFFPAVDFIACFIPQLVVLAITLIVYIPAALSD